MKFDELDLKMRVYETAHDYCYIPNQYLIARIDGRSFTKLTKETYKFEAPFDDKFRDYMIETTKHLMNCGFNAIYGFTESDEISLLFKLNEDAFSRKNRKFLSILAGEASAKFSVQLGGPAAFDCRISEIPNKELVVDYFRWRSEDAHRNALNAHCYWILRKNNHNKTAATRKVENLSTADKNELLFEMGINFNNLPKWQKRGVGVYWGEIETEGFNPKLNKKQKATRRDLKVEMELPMKERYSNFIREIIS
jgi:tRNA(His) guanylyltransferase